MCAKKRAAAARREYIREECIMEYFNLFDFTLTDDEMADIAKTDKNVRYYTATKQMLQGYLAMAPDFDSQE